MEETDPNPSELGTYDHWSNVYQKDLADFQDFKDPGTEWFGRSATKRIVKWVTACPDVTKESSILDIGCGNGLLLLELAKLGYTNLIGVDYCKDALELAKSVFLENDLPDDIATWIPLDITNQTLISTADTNSMTPWECHKPFPENFNQCKFSLCLDKGTYDAVSLCPDDARQKRLLYVEQVKRFLSITPGYFVIASCNWTTSELKSHFSELQFVAELPAPTFTFGGKTGQTVSTCVFR